MKLRWLWVLAIALSFLSPPLVPELAAAAPAASKGVKKPKKRAKPQKLVLKLQELDRKTKPKQVKALRRSVKKVKGVVAVKPNKKKGELVVHYRPGTDAMQIRDAVKSAGFTVVEQEAKPAADPLAAEEDDEGGGDPPAASKPVDDDLPEGF